MAGCYKLIDTIETDWAIFGDLHKIKIDFFESEPEIYLDSGVHVLYLVCSITQNSKDLTFYIYSIIM